MKQDIGFSDSIDSHEHVFSWIYTCKNRKIILVVMLKLLIYYVQLRKTFITEEKCTWEWIASEKKYYYGFRKPINQMHHKCFTEMFLNVTASKSNIIDINSLLNLKNLLVSKDSEDKIFFSEYG